MGEPSRAAGHRAAPHLCAAGGRTSARLVGVLEASMSEPDLDFIVSLIDGAEIPKAEKAYLKAAAETEGGIPEITGDRQYRAYAEFSKELRRGLPEHGSSGFSRALVQWAHSKDGIYAMAF